MTQRGSLPRSFTGYQHASVPPRLLARCLSPLPLGLFRAAQVMAAGFPQREGRERGERERMGECRERETRDGESKARVFVLSSLRSDIPSLLPYSIH